ncbi:MAG: hypothetical protein ABFR95_09955 [Actinomycetota bacterium]
MKALAMLIAMAVMVTACAGSTAGTTSTTAGDEGIEAVDIDGVWVFEHDPEAGMQALHSGVPEIVDGCLEVGGFIVVWPTDMMDEAKAAVTAATAGDAEPITIGGGGFGEDEGLDPSEIPPALSERCSVDAIWYASS